MNVFWWWLLILSLAARIAKGGLIFLFFKTEKAGKLKKLPSVSLIQPITAGASHLESNLRSRLLQTYPGQVQHILVCDASDHDSHQLCVKLASSLAPQNRVVIALTKTARASKVEKIAAAMKKASGEILVFIDDDIELHRDGLQLLVTQLLLHKKGGAVFGLPTAFGSHNNATTLMTLVVNYFAPLFYLPLASATPPFTITGHWYAVRRAVYNQIGGTKIFEQRLDDDNHLAVQLTRRGYTLVQSSVQYTVHNYFESFGGIFNQLKRWMIFPQQTILPYLSLKKKTIVLLICIDFLLPFVLILSIPFVSGLEKIIFLTSLLCLIYLSYLGMNVFKKEKDLSLRELLWLPLVAILAPVVMVFLTLTNDHVFKWRGKTIKLYHRGTFDELDS